MMISVIYYTTTTGTDHQQHHHLFMHQYTHHYPTSSYDSSIFQVKLHDAIFNWDDVISAMRHAAIQAIFTMHGLCHNVVELR
ncbi:predicted protein [Lichtheimia corymbifera JMRC:FSU:9682]|uniref:Uncharacterized protein n=1 Tax=Lichtheimia corymbifera JMRC:FSU:9682 TaxID=1263082 RepID=A0A068RF45_9FUNG|nr:predicted protein [Lichtheimia corymbifera JMRC:FSU:9682]